MFEFVGCTRAGFQFFDHFFDSQNAATVNLNRNNSYLIVRYRQWESPIEFCFLERCVS